MTFDTRVQGTALLLFQFFVSLLYSSRGVTLKCHCSSDSEHTIIGPNKQVVIRCEEIETLEREGVRKREQDRKNRLHDCH